MGYTIPITKEMACAQMDARASQKAALAVCRKINNLKFPEAKSFVQKLVSGKQCIGRKFYSKAASNVLELLEGIEKNARQKNLEPEKMRLNISVHRGPTLMRARHKRRIGIRMKICKIGAVLLPEKSQSEVQSR